MSKIALTSANVSCAHCARLISGLLSKERGVTSVHVDSLKTRITVGFDTGLTSPQSILRVMERSGYPARLIAEVPAAPPRAVMERAA